MYFLAADPGVEGAIAAYDVRSGRIEVYDMPKHMVQVGRREPRNAVAPGPLYEMLHNHMVLGATHLFCEQVGGIPGQSAPAAFNFGRGYGYLEMAATILGLRWEPVPSIVWKKVMKAPADKKASISRACELLPELRGKFEGGGRGKASNGSEAQRSGRAEACMLALYGERVLRGVR